MYRSLPLESFELNQPVPINIWDPKGVLLLRKGEKITSEQHRGHLMLHGPVVLASDWQAMSYGYTATLDRMVRDNQPLQRIAGLNALTVQAAAPRQTTDELPAPEAWAELHAALATLLHQGPDAHQFIDVSRLLRDHGSMSPGCCPASFLVAWSVTRNAAPIKKCCVQHLLHRAVLRAPPRYL